MTGHGDPGPDPLDGVPIAPDLWLAWVLPATGDRWPWLIRAGLPPGREQCGCSCARCCPHEQDGALPPLYRARLRVAAHHDDDGGQP